MKFLSILYKRLKYQMNPHYRNWNSKSLSDEKKWLLDMIFSINAEKWITFLSFPKWVIEISLSNPYPIVIQISRHIIVCQQKTAIRQNRRRNAANILNTIVRTIIIIIVIGHTIQNTPQPKALYQCYIQ